MTVSKLATPYMFQNFGAQRWWVGRSQAITTITIHHAATTNFDAMPGVWKDREASAHYGIGQTGIIRAYVDEENTAWHCGNGNAYSIGIECTNTSGDPNWGVSDATVDALVKLIQEIQSRRGKLQIVGHRDVPGNSTICPGPSLYPRLTEIRNRVNSGTSTPSTPSTPTGTKNGIAIDNVSKDQAVKMVQRTQTDYAWTLLRDQVKRVLQPNKVYTLVITCDSKWKYENAVNRLKQELKTYYPGYMQQNIAIVDGDKPIIKIEARNLNDEQSKKMEAHMRNFLKDILLDGQTYAETNSYGTYDVRIKGEGFNDHDAPIVLKEIQEMGKAKDVGINPTHIKGFKY